MFDTRTLMLAVALGNLALAVLLAAVGRGSGLALSGRLWGLAKAGEGAGFLLVALRGEIGDVLSIPIANTLLLAGFALEAAATWELLHLKSWRRFVPGLGAVSIAVFWIAYLAGAGLPLRALIVSVEVGTCFALTTAAFFVQWRGVSLLGRFIGVIDLIGACVAIGRAVVMQFGAQTSPFVATPLQIGTFIALYLYMVTHGFGFLLLTKEAADRETLRLATLDPLTEVLNRRAFFAQTEAALALARRNGQPLSMLMLDLDHFKRINDGHGHQTGDAVIRELVRVCRHYLRESDLLGRLGGEEFAVALPSTSLEGARRVAERIREETAKSIARGPGGREVRFTVSIGATQANGESAIDPILARADGALYEAKRQGRDRVISLAAGAAATPA